jgi:hypothetical protein
MDVIIDSIIEFGVFVINLIGIFLIISLFIWLNRPLFTSYRLSPDGIDIMLLSIYKLYRINFEDITDIRVGGYISELMFPSLREFRRRKMVLDKLHPKQVMIITTAKSGKITYWVLSTTPLDYIRNHTDKYGIA